jgi:hypothetical protein
MESDLIKEIEINFPPELKSTWKEKFNGFEVWRKFVKSVWAEHGHLLNNKDYWWMITPGDYGLFNSGPDMTIRVYKREVYPWEQLNENKQRSIRDV